MNHRVSDLIIRIKNASLSKRKEVVLDDLKINKSICKVLVKAGFLDSVENETRDGKKVLLAKIRYDKRVPVLNDVLVVSKPSLRIYATSDEISGLQRRGRITLILSTNEGIMTGMDAMKKKVGGEVLFKIW